MLADGGIIVWIVDPLNSELGLHIDTKVVILRFAVGPVEAELHFVDQRRTERMRIGDHDAASGNIAQHTGRTISVFQARGRCLRSSSSDRLAQIGGFSR